MVSPFQRIYMKTCSIAGCARNKVALGFCGMHYQRFNKRGTTKPNLKRLIGFSAIERILLRIKINKNGCWILQGKLTTNGYGYVNNKDKGSSTAHIITYEQKYGSVPKGQELDHFFCKTKRCCNPDHVEPVTHIENVRRGRCAKVARARMMKLTPKQRSIRARKAALKRWRTK